MNNLSISLPSLPHLSLFFGCRILTVARLRLMFGSVRKTKSGAELKPNMPRLFIAKSLDAVGAAYNAFTSEEHTGFFVRAAAEHFDLALDILFDMLTVHKLGRMKP